ncbi:MAG: BlaI/MecI/CopY family transcriptional regulator [Alphaproteobacteria bacterium]|nr:BlaI/MecI/CopY family transcriptional regulator [Alphaproteobacteria bacterium]
MSLQITPAELDIMKVLWRKPGLGASEVADALKTSRDWNIRTIKTMLARLVEKGALETKQDGRRFLYSPLVEKGTYQKKAAGQLVDRLFGGRAAPLIAQLADARGLTDDDIEELEALLGRLKK